MLFLSNSCATVSGTLGGGDDCQARVVNGAAPQPTKCKRGSVTRLTASLQSSPFTCPRNRIEQVTPVINFETSWFGSASDGSGKLRGQQPMRKRASLSIQKTRPFFPTSR
jgi:hypothetical protein